jgi:hypothetical protein
MGLLFDFVAEFWRDVIYNNSQVVATVVNRPSNFSVPHVLFDLTFDFPPFPEWEKKRNVFGRFFHLFMSITVANLMPCRLGG